MITKAYIETTNRCNLNCRFCNKIERPLADIKLEDFKKILDKLNGKVKFLYFHLMGEPLLNDNISEFIKLSKDYNFIPVLTTNGTLLESKIDALLKSKPYRINVSLHSFEANQNVITLDEYMRSVINSINILSSNGIIISLRLWNEGGYNNLNDKILKILKEEYIDNWEESGGGYFLKENIYLNFDKMFKWPNIDSNQFENEVFCYGLRNQIGILVDGTVVPCCLDTNGKINLGNIYENTLDEILSSKKAKAIYDGFSKHIAIEELCKTCGYANLSKKYHKK